MATTDLLPTLCDLTGTPVPEVVAGRPRWHADRPPESVFGQTLHGIDLATEQWTEHLSIVRAGWRWGEAVLRPAHVTVVAEPAAEGGDSTEDGDSADDESGDEPS